MHERLTGFECPGPLRGLAELGRHPGILHGLTGQDRITAIRRSAMDPADPVPPRRRLVDACARPN